MYVCTLVFNQISKDDGVRAGTNMEALSRLKPAFNEHGSTTAGLLLLMCFELLFSQFSHLYVV